MSDGQIVGAAYLAALKQSSPPQVAGAATVRTAEAVRLGKTTVSFGPITLDCHFWRDLTAN